MKKTYIVPKVQILDYQSAQMIASSMGVYSSTTVDTEEEGGQLGNNRRGTWGDLWSEN
jgi:hypothetical protein